jgi:hypothetical protein
MQKNSVGYNKATDVEFFMTWIKSQIEDLGITDVAATRKYMGYRSGYQNDFSLKVRGDRKESDREVLCKLDRMLRRREKIDAELSEAKKKLKKLQDEKDALIKLDVGG